MKICGNLTLEQGGAILNLTVESLNVDPTTPNSGQSWFNSASKEYKFYDGTTVQSFLTKTALQAAVAKFASTASGEGASLIGLHDAAGNYVSANVEDALTEAAVALKALNTDIKSVAAGKGADMIGLHDADDQFTATTVGAAFSELYLKVTANTSAASALAGVTGAASLAEINYGSTLVNIANTDTLMAAIGKLDSAVSSAGGMTLQAVYDNSVTDDTDPANKFVAIKLATNKDFRIVDDTDDTVYFGIDSETGAVTISGDLRVSGTTTTVESTVTKFSSQLIEVGAPGIVGLTIKPETAVTPAADLIAAYISGAEDATPVFRLGADGKLYGGHGEFSGSLSVTGTVNGVDVAVLNTAFGEHTDTSGSKHAASNIGFTPLEGSALTASNVQTAVEELEAADKALKDSLASTTADKGAALVGVSAVEGLTATNVQGAVEEVFTVAKGAAATATQNAGHLATLTNNLGSTDADKGASLIGIADAAGQFTATNVEEALAELYVVAAASTNYMYDGSTPAATHNVKHDLASKYVNVVVVDNADEMVIPESIRFVDANNLVVTFGAAFACKVFVSK